MKMMKKNGVAEWVWMELWFDGVFGKREGCKSECESVGEMCEMDWGEEEWSSWLDAAFLEEMVCSSDADFS